MKTRISLFIVICLSGIFAACNPEKSVTPTPQGDPLVPTVEILNTTVPSPTPQSEPATPTPEIFNALDPSPTPSGSELPLTCQVTDLNVQIDRSNGYCFAYPKRFRFDNQPIFNVMAVQGPPVGSSTEPVFTTFYVETASSAPGQTLDQQVDAFLKEFTTVDPASLSRTKITLDGEEAILVDQVPGYLSWRIVFAAHDGRLYHLMYWPVDVPEAQTDLEELYQTTLNSYAYITPTQGLEGNAPQEVALNVDGVAQGFTSQVYEAVPASQDSPWWVPMPQHLQLTLQGYPVSNHLKQPQIFVYPVKDLEVNEVATQFAGSLQALLQGQPAGEELPYLPLDNSAQMMVARRKYLDFMNGKGVSYLTQYTQGIVPVNNHELVYTYQGLTNDGKYYVAVVMPVNLASLPTEGNWDGQEPPTGSDYTKNMRDIVATLDEQQASAFTPDLDKLDTLVQSIEIKYNP
jgi:hypothetical protein